MCSLASALPASALTYDFTANRGFHKVGSIRGSSLGSGNWGIPGSHGSSPVSNCPYLPIGSPLRNSKDGGERERFIFINKNEENKGEMVKEKKGKKKKKRRIKCKGWKGGGKGSAIDEHTVQAMTHHYDSSRIAIDEHTVQAGRQWSRTRSSTNQSLSTTLPYRSHSGHMSGHLPCLKASSPFLAFNVVTLPSGLRTSA